MPSGARRLRLALVVQRYGLDIAGGAEYHCRLVAEHLARHASVTVRTTCADDYVTWANRYPEGEEAVNGIAVRRFLGENGRRYFEANYAWPVVEGKYLDLLARLRREDEAA